MTCTALIRTLLALAFLGSVSTGIASTAAADAAIASEGLDWSAILYYILAGLGIAGLLIIRRQSTLL